MGKKSDSKKQGKSGGNICAGCKNFEPGKGRAGTCGRTDKKRSSNDKACSHYKPM